MFNILPLVFDRQSSFYEFDHVDTVVLIKIVSAIIYPLGFSVILWLLSLVSSGFRAKRLAWSLRCLSILIVLLASNAKFATWLASSLENQYPQVPMADIAEHDAVIVLGGGVRIPLPPAQHVQIGSGSDRFWYAVQLYRAAKAQRIILLGGNVFKQNGFQGEAYYARELLLDWGVPKEVILIESESRTTEQNMQNLGSLLKQQGVKSALLVTSALHMPRSIELFRQLPIMLSPASADVLIREHHSPKVLSWIPSANALELTTVSLHEYYGKWFNWLKRVFA